jgi:hypothetical protein
MTLTPSDPQAGETFEASFDELNSRGGYFTLERWENERWSDPVFLLESDALVGSPEVRPAGRMEMMDYGVEGVGPDGLVMPDQIEPGYWRLCTANAADHACVQLVVTA